METMGGIEEEIISFVDEEDQQRSSSDGYKSVPWLTWDEWDAVRESLFSSSADNVASALERISTWRTRGSLPAPIDVTASIIEIQQKDGFIAREKQPVDALYSEHLLQMLYCMAILRLVNCVIEKTRRRTEVSIGEAAEAIGIPRKLIDVRHEGSHRELPALSVLRDVADEALGWLKSYYWEPQKNQIPFKKDGMAKVRREIKSKLCKLAFCLQIRQSPQLGSAVVKEKCSKKRIGKILNALVELYSSFSSEVVSVLLELLMKALASSNRMDIPNESDASEDLGALHEWKLVILEFSNKEPELLLNLLQAVIDTNENKEQRRYEIDFKEASQTEQLPILFAWLVGRLKGLKHFQHNGSSERKASNTILMELMRKCLILSAFTNTRFMDPALELAKLMGGSVCREKIRKLALMPTLDVIKGQNSPLMSPQSHADQDKSIQYAAKKLELIKLQLSKKKSTGINETISETSKRWVKAKTWKSCPIGMLPQILGSSGRLPLLDCTETLETAQTISNSEESFGLKPCSGKREAELSIRRLDDSSLKRVRESLNHEPGDGRDTRYLDDSSLKMSDSIEKLDSDGEDLPTMEEGRGCLMVGGAWKRVGEEEVLAIASAVRILV